LGNVTVLESIILRLARALAHRGRSSAAIVLLDRVAARTDSPEVLRELVRQRRAAFVASSPAGSSRDQWPPRYDDRFASGPTPPEIPASELDAAAIGAGVIHHGSLIVRGLFAPDQVTDLRTAFESTFDAADNPIDPDPGWYSPFPDEGNSMVLKRRHWVREAGCVWVADAPRTLFRYLRAFEDVGILDTLTEYFGERPAFSLEKSTLRWAKPVGEPEWHQDGAFMGADLRTINIWIALTPCGGDRDVPALDLVPRRFDEIVETGTRGAHLDHFVGIDLINELALETPIVRPVFEPGDAIIFDERALHATAIEPGMTGERLAIEFWFFAPSTVPARYLPMVL